MDASQYDPQAVANAEAKILHEQDKYPHPRRRDARDYLMRAMAQCIADNVVSGSAQWAEQVEEYRYLRDLPWDGGQPPAVQGVCTLPGGHRDDHVFSGPQQVSDGKPAVLRPDTPVITVKAPQ